MNCLYCGKLHEGYCQQNPEFWDGPEDVKVPAGSEAEADFEEERRKN